MKIRPILNIYRKNRKMFLGKIPSFCFRKKVKLNESKRQVISEVNLRQKYTIVIFLQLVVNKMVET